MKAEKTRKKICIIYTGGTIGMTAGKNGYEPSDRLLAESLEDIKDLTKPGMPELEVIQFSPLLDSSNMGIQEWNRIGRTIEQNYDRFDGFVVLHGTDTMAYSASALSFMLENLRKPVIFTGSQIPLCEVRSDGYSNIVSAILIASQGIANEVCVYFDGVLLRGCRSKKTSSNRFAAFESPNCGKLADAGIEIEYHRVPAVPEPDGEFRFTELKEIPVGIIKIFPGIEISLFESLMTEQFRGVVLESFGAGNIPSRSGGELIPIIDKAYRNGTLIVVCSQCVQGTVSLGTYETSHSLKEIGAVNGNDMTVEAAMTKLIYLFSRDLPVDEIRRLMKKNLRGEMTEE